jgi:hypothetical protein
MHGTAGAEGRRDVTLVFLTCLVVGLMISLLMLFLFDPTRVRIFPVCTFHRLTELDCPGCGSLRAMHQLLNGNVMTAFRHNPLLIGSLPLFAWIGCRFVWRTWRREPGWTVRPLWIWIYGALWIVFGIARNLPNSVFAFAA